MRGGRRTAAFTAAAILIAAAGCSGSDDTTTLTMLAATSLTTPFMQLAHDYESAHPGVHIRTSFGGSDVLVAQVREGSTADVLATADLATMQTAESAHALAGPKYPVASNVLVIAVPKDNPAHITSLSDLAEPNVRVAAINPNRQM